MKNLLLVGLAVFLLGCSNGEKTEISENVGHAKKIEYSGEVMTKAANGELDGNENFIPENQHSPETQFNPDDYISISKDTLEAIKQLGALQLYTISDVANDEQLYNAYMMMLNTEANANNQESLNTNTLSEYEKLDQIKTSTSVIQELIQNARTKLVIPLIHEDNPSEDLWDKKKSFGAYLEVYRNLLYKHDLGSSFFNIEVQGTSCKMPNTVCEGFNEANNYSLPFSNIEVNTHVYRSTSILQNANPYLVFPFNGIGVKNEQEARELEKLLHESNVYWEGRAFIDIVKSDKSNEHITQNLAYLPYNKNTNLPFVYTALEVQFFNKETGEPITNKRLLLPHQGENTETFQYLPQ